MTDGSGTRTLAYDPSGQLDSETYTAGLFAGLGVDRSFDSLSRLASVSALSAASALVQIGYGYDAASRLSTVTSGPNAATYSYLGNSPLVRSVAFQQSGATRHTTTRTYDRLNRLSAISNQPSASTVHSVAYTYNAANQRTRATREDSARWNYAYDALGQVTSGVKTDAAGAVLPAHDFAWDYDDIGNRKSATRNSSIPGAARAESFTSNLLNQYTQRTVPGSFDLLAAASPGTTVSYRYPAATGAPTPLPLYGDLHFARLTADNAAASVMTNVKVTGVKNDAGPAGEDAIAEITREVFLPRNPEAFTYDADGNLTADGKWVYTWDGENRLTRLSLPAGMIQAGQPRELVEFTYDGQGRRTSKKYTDSVRAGTSAMQTSFFNNASLSGAPAFVEEWWTLHASWGGSPGAGVGADNFSVRWSGRIAAPASGLWNIGAVWSQNDDVRLWVGGQLLVDMWTGPGTSGSGAIQLEAGVEYPLVLEFRNASSVAQVQLRWSGPGVTDTAVTAMVNSNYPGQTTVTTTRYLYDGWNLLAELTSPSAPQPFSLSRTYAWGLDLSGSLQGAGGVGGLLFATQHSSQVTSHSVSYDGNGNVIGYVDMGTGTKSAIYEYGAFGETLIADGVAAEAMPFRFSTKYTDNETGLIYYGYRFFKDGRWPNRDPLEESGGLNLYGFVENDSLNYFDPLGREPQSATPTLDPSGKGSQWRGPDGRFAPPPKLPPPPPGSNLLPKPETFDSRSPSNSPANAAAAAVDLASNLLTAAQLSTFLNKGRRDCAAQMQRTGGKCASCCVIRIYQMTRVSVWGNRVFYIYGFGKVIGSPCGKVKEELSRHGEITPYYGNGKSLVQDNLTDFLDW